MLNERDQDTLKELVNIAFGRSAAVIADMMGAFATLHLPNIKVLSYDELEMVINERIRLSSTQILAVSQHFFGGLEGETVFMVDSLSMGNLARLLTGEGGERERLDQDALLDPVMEIGNVVSASCVRGLTDQLELEVVFSRPGVEVLPMEGLHLDDQQRAPFQNVKVILINTELDFQEERIWGSLYIVLEPASFNTFLRLLQKMAE